MWRKFFLDIGNDSGDWQVWVAVSQGCHVTTKVNAAVERKDGESSIARDINMVSK